MTAAVGAAAADVPVTDWMYAALPTQIVNEPWHATQGFTFHSRPRIKCYTSLPCDSVLCDGRVRFE